MFGCMNLASLMMLVTSSRPSFRIFQFLSPILDTNSDVILSLKRKEQSQYFNITFQFLWTRNKTGSSVCYRLINISLPTPQTDNYNAYLKREKIVCFLAGLTEHRPDIRSWQKIHNIISWILLFFSIFTIIPTANSMPRIASSWSRRRLSLHLKRKCMSGKWS